MGAFPRLVGVEPLPEKRLLARFENGEKRIYDCTALVRSDPFRILANDAFFRHVRPAPGGYGVVWDDRLDLAESEIWLNGSPAP